MKLALALTATFGLGVSFMLTAVLMLQGAVPLNPGVDRAPGPIDVPADCDSIQLVRDSTLVVTVRLKPKCCSGAFPDGALLEVKAKHDAYADSVAAFVFLGERAALLAVVDPLRYQLPPGQYEYTYVIFAGEEPALVKHAGVLTVDNGGKRLFERAGEARK